MTRGRGRRCRILLAGTLVLTLAAMPAAPGRTAPVEPLQHAPSRAGEWGFEAAATVIPFGRRLPVPDGSGGQTTQTHLEYGAGLSVAASYTVTDAWTVSLSAAADGTVWRAGASGGPAADWRWEGGPLRAGLGAQWRLGGSGPVRHRLALDADFGEAVVFGLAWRADAVRDPVVLSGGAGIEMAAGSGARAAVSLSLGLGFVANDHVSMAVSARHRLPPAPDGLPYSGLTAGVYYSPGRDGRLTWGFETTLHVQGPDVRAGFGVSLSLAAGPR